jgi:hypothetical protein
MSDFIKGVKCFYPFDNRKMDVREADHNRIYENRQQEVKSKRRPVKKLLFSGIKK